MGNNDSSVPPEWNDQIWSRNIKTFFDSSKITDPLNFNADFLIRLTPIRFKTSKKKRKFYNQEDNHKLKDHQSYVFAFISKDGEFTVLSHVLPDILYHAILDNTQITSACLFHPSNTIIASAVNRNSIIVATFSYLNDDNIYDSTSFSDSKFDFVEIKGIEAPQLVEKVDNDSFLVSDSKSSIYILSMKDYLSNRSDDTSSPYQKLIDSPRPSEPKCLSYFNGYVALSSSTGLLIGKIRPSQNLTKTTENESLQNTQITPCSLFYPDLANVHHLTFIKANDSNVLLFFISANNQAAVYIKINDISNTLEEREQNQKLVQLLISADDPVQILGSSKKNEIIFFTDLIHPEAHKNNSKDDDSSNKTIIFSRGTEIHSFTLTSSFLSANASTKIHIQDSIQVQVQSASNNQDDDSNSDISDEIKNYSCSNSIVKLLCTNEPRIFAALFTDGTVVICRHPPYSIQGSSKDSNPSSVSTSIETAKLFNYHRCRPTLACVADDFSFLTFDENHVAILWESLPDWWSAPFYLKMFADNNEDDDRNEYLNGEEEKNEDFTENIKT